MPGSQGYCIRYSMQSSKVVLDCAMHCIACNASITSLQLPECCSHCTRRGEQRTALQSTAISERLHPFCISISFCRSMQQHVVCSWAQAASLGYPAMLCTTLQLWSLASKVSKTLHCRTAQGHTCTQCRLSSARPFAKQAQTAAATAGAAYVAIGS